MSRAAALLFSTVAYAIFFATFLYLIAFVGNLPFAALTVDRGPGAPCRNRGHRRPVADIPVRNSAQRDGAAGLQARLDPDRPRRSGAQHLRAHRQRGSIVMFLFWRPIPQVIWDATGSALELPLWILFAAGWLIVLLSTFLINHFELFGLQQAWFHARSRQAKAHELHQPFFYRGSRIRSIRGSSSPSGRPRR